MRLNAKQICDYTGGQMAVEPMDARALVCGITWDSRKVCENDLYVALPGAQTDGHRFVAAALSAHALCILVSERLDGPTYMLAREMGAAVIEVPHTAAAITDLARVWRSHLRGTVIALSGSAGKTTTKNLVRDVLAAHGSVVATEGNQNNELGVPRTLLRADPETQFVVVEMGMRGAEQIAGLCEFVRPDWGLITNIGESHIELLGSVENIARAKAELICALPDQTGQAILNAADPYTPFICAEAACRARNIAVSLFGGTGDGPAGGTGGFAYADDIALDSEGKPSFTLHMGSDPEHTPHCSLNLRGVHNVCNALAAACVGAVAGMDARTVADALGKAEPALGRQCIVRGRAGFLIVDDTYNANPDSMRAALSMFCALEVPGRRVAVLGDMGELGECARPCHEGIGRFAAGLPLDRLICVGELARFIAGAARAAGMPGTSVVEASSIAEVFEEVDGELGADDAVLVKASRFMGLERVVGGLVD